MKEDYYYYILFLSYLETLFFFVCLEINYRVGIEDVFFFFFFFFFFYFFFFFFFFFCFKILYIIKIQNDTLYCSFIINNFFNNKFLNTLFIRNINNYYSNDFFLRNSKIMSLSAIKTYIKF